VQGLYPAAAGKDHPEANGILTISIWNGLVQSLIGQFQNGELFGLPILTAR
jgi:hypothetical protein